MDAVSSRSLSESETNRIRSRVRVAWTAKWLLVGLIVAVGTLALSVGPPLRPLVLAGAALLPIVGLASAIVRHRRFRYAVTDEAVYVRRGLFTVNETVVPPESIQQVDVDEPLLMRPFELVSVRIYTAGTFGGRVAIPGLLRGDATDLADRLDELARSGSGV